MLVSHVTKILLTPGLSWSIVVRQSQLTTRRLILSNAYWWIAVHAGKVVLHSLWVRGVRIEVCSARLGRNTEMYLTNPKNCHMCFAHLGASQFRILLTFVLSASIPHTEMWCPRKSISVVNNEDFFCEQYSSAFCSTSRISETLVLCSASELDQIIMSSR